MASVRKAEHLGQRSQLTRNTIPLFCLRIAFLLGVKGINLPHATPEPYGDNVFGLANGNSR